MAIAIFATQNTFLVNLRFFAFESIKLPLGLVLIFSAGCGATCINIWQASIGFELPTVPKFSVFSNKTNPSKHQTVAKTAGVTKDISRASKKPQKVKDDFDDDWDEDWG
ncbi:LapA family protein [Pseudanabaena sp. BC1403]|uniref:LapA family protein n=1 Tax=Pseudanabaena sp. BC1403 TaxID=2043171 RepID=UPI0015E16490|nr:LapA family protein [Pseudanabaena sp. BC1403]